MTEQYITPGERAVLREIETGAYWDKEMRATYYDGCEECWETGWTECLGHEVLPNWPVLRWGV